MEREKRKRWSWAGKDTGIRGAIRRALLSQGLSASRRKKEKPLRLSFRFLLQQEKRELAQHARQTACRNKLFVKDKRNCFLSCCLNANLDLIINVTDGMYSKAMHNTFVNEVVPFKKLHFHARAASSLLAALLSSNMRTRSALTCSSGSQLSG